MPKRKVSKREMRERADKLRQVRVHLGLNQRDMAKKLESSLGSISMWENCERQIPGPAWKLIRLYDSGKLRKDE